MRTREFGGLLARLNAIEEQLLRHKAEISICLGRSPDPSETTFPDLFGSSRVSNCMSKDRR
jgi:hypothetical protein